MSLDNPGHASCLAAAVEHSPLAKLRPHLEALGSARSEAPLDVLWEKALLRLFNEVTETTWSGATRAGVLQITCSRL